MLVIYKSFAPFVWTIELLTLTRNKAKLYLHNTNASKTNLGLDKSEKRQN